jgi:hypothetical protein
MICDFCAVHQAYELNMILSELVGRIHSSRMRHDRSDVHCANTTTWISLLT